MFSLGHFLSGMMAANKLGSRWAPLQPAHDCPIYAAHLQYYVVTQNADKIRYTAISQHSSLQDDQGIELFLFNVSQLHCEHIIFLLFLVYCKNIYSIWIELLYESQD